MSSGTGDFLTTCLRALAPRRCRLCGLPGPETLALCTPCRQALRDNRNACCRCALPLPAPATPGAGQPRLCPRCLARPPRLTRVVAPFVYDESLGFLIGRWKYHREEALAATFARLWIEAAAPAPAADLLLPVPMHWRRLLWRGCNHSADLAWHLHRGGCGPLRGPVSLQRVRATPQQAGSARARRLQNLRGAFRVRGDPRGLRIALIDDVCTTGATAETAAAALLRAGAAQVQLWCLARTAA